VEEYLKSRGIYLDGQSSFIEVDPVVVSLLKTANKTANSNSDGTSSSDRSPMEAIIRTPSPPLGADAFIHPITDPYISREYGELYGPSSTLFPALPSTSNSTTQTSKSSDDPWAAFLNPAPTFADLLSTHSRRQTQSPLTFDVEMFLERMIQGSACLGRAPGFRKETIDQALSLSLQESF